MTNSDIDPGSLPGSSDIHALLEFLPLFETTGFSAGEFVNEPSDESDFAFEPYFELGDCARQFVEALYSHNFVRPFDWGEWQHEASLFVEDSALLNQADLETVCKLLTTHVRKERFCEGHLAAMFECAHVVAVLRRLDAIAAANDE